MNALANAMTCVNVAESAVPYHEELGAGLQGPLYYVLSVASRFHREGTRTGLTRLRRGVWQLTPRGAAT